MKHYSIKTILILLIAIALTQCDNNNTEKSTRAEDQNTATQTTTTPQNKTNEQTIADDAVEAIKAAVPLAQKGIENRRYRDSIRAANKEEFWVYTIGVPFEDVDQMADAFDKLKTIEGMAVYDNDGEYTLIKTGTSEEEMDNQYGTFKKTLTDAGMGSLTVKTVNLTGFCSKKGHVKYGQGRKLRKKHPEIPAYQCD